MLYKYSERGHSGLLEYVLLEKLNFLKKNRLSDGGLLLREWHVILPKAL
jgi:hypothetical protein